MGLVIHKDEFGGAYLCADYREAECFMSNWGNTDHVIPTDAIVELLYGGVLVLDDGEYTQTIRVKEAMK